MMIVIKTTGENGPMPFSGSGPERLLRLLVIGYAGWLVVVGRIELGVVGAPGRGLDDTVDLTQPRGGQPQGDNLADAHHHIPAHHLDALGRKRLVKPLLLELGVELAERTRLVMLEEDGQHDRI